MRLCALLVVIALTVVIADNDDDDPEISLLPGDLSVPVQDLQDFANLELQDGVLNVSAVTYAFKDTFVENVVVQPPEGEVRLYMLEIFNRPVFLNVSGSIELQGATVRAYVYKTGTYQLADVFFSSVCAISEEGELY